ncbi:MAG TPA: hypothetical protein VES01_05775 [Dermatophilaceae bacterium]|nr:hypothetical protein [Dermatophilaceae bacterium]
MVSPSECLSRDRTIGLSMQHAVAILGAAFVFPALIGPSPQLAIMVSGVATLLFLVLTARRVPSDSAPPPRSVGDR